MSKRRRPTATILMLTLVALICLGSCVAFVVYLELNRRVEVTFGPASPSLNPIDRLRFSSQLLFQVDQLLEPVDRFGDSEFFEIPLGEPPPRIASRLEASGLIHDAQAFVSYLRYAGLDTTIQAGRYNLSPSTSPLEIAQILQDATPSEVTLSVLPGWRIEEVTATLPTSGLEITQEEFLSAAYSPPQGYLMLEDLPQGNSVEGFLYPGSYRLPRQTNAELLVQILVENFTAQLTPELLNGFQNQGLDIYSAVTLASIIEREAVNADEMPMIASVFLNRLAIGMPLEADSTVQYSLGYNQDQITWWTNPLSRRDLQFDSPYNSYLYTGLPPGPIANPGSRALRAVAFPVETPYYYFRAVCDGSGKHTFSETLEEHLSKGCP
jgi:UPF0755 protein